MQDQKSTQDNFEMSQEELDKLDSELLQIETLYRSRCISPPRGSNVIVREIEDKE